MHLQRSLLLSAVFASIACGGADPRLPPSDSGITQDGDASDPPADSATTDVNASCPESGWPIEHCLFDQISGQLSCEGCRPGCMYRRFQSAMFVNTCGHRDEVDRFRPATGASETCPDLFVHRTEAFVSMESFFAYEAALPCPR